jgi:hypothetical protein
MKVRENEIKKIPGILTVLLVIAAAAPAKDKQAPLPEKIITSKTVFIQCEDAKLKDKAYTALTKWEKYAVVDSADKADLVMVIETSKDLSGFTSHTQKGYDFSHGGQNSQLATAPDTTKTHAEYTHTTSIKIVDAKTGESLWADSHKASFHGATKDLIEELQKRVEKQTGTKK